LRFVQETRRQKAVGIVASRAGSRRNFFRRLIRDMQRRADVVEKLEHRMRVLWKVRGLAAQLEFSWRNRLEIARRNVLASEWIGGHRLGYFRLLRFPSGIERRI